MNQPTDENVLGTPLQLCCNEPTTGFFRNGYCQTGPHDHGSHIVCAIMTDSFLKFSKAQGNDLISPVPLYGFPGLKAGDKWCLCATRWMQALTFGMAPPIVLEATHKKMLELVDLKILKEHSLQASTETEHRLQ